MIYLFNSGFQPLYRRNVRRTMFLPSCAANQYRYRAAGERQNISPEMVAKLQSTARGTQVAIIFIDRFAAEGYRFIPLRLAKFLKAWRDGERHYVAVQLKDFIQARDLPAFNRVILGTLGNRGLPKRVGDGSGPDDGEYVIEGPDIFQDAASYELGQPAWDHTVEQLYETRAFKEAEEGLPLFCRCRLRRERDEHELTKASVSGAESFLRLTRGHGYIVDLYYKVGIPRQKTAGLRIELRGEDGVSIAKPLSVMVDADSNAMQLRLKARRYAEEPVGSIDFVTYEGDKEIPDSSIPVPYRIKARKTFWLWMILCVVSFALFSAIKSYDFSKHIPAPIPPQGAPPSPPLGPYDQLLAWIAPWALLVRISAELMQVAAVLAMVRLLGRKPI